MVPSALAPNWMSGVSRGMRGIAQVSCTASSQGLYCVQSAPKSPDPVTAKPRSANSLRNLTGASARRPDGPRPAGAGIRPYPMVRPSVPRRKSGSRDQARGGGAMTGSASASTSPTRSRGPKRVTGMRASPSRTTGTGGGGGDSNDRLGSRSCGMIQRTVSGWETVPSCAPAAPPPPATSRIAAPGSNRRVVTRHPFYRRARGRHPRSPRTRPREDRAARMPRGIPPPAARTGKRAGIG